MPIPPFTPAAPENIRHAFDHDDYIFELKMDGFRALAHVGPDETRLVSRRGNVYKRFTELAAAINRELDCEAVLDGEIVCLDTSGRPRFYDLLRRRGIHDYGRATRSPDAHVLKRRLYAGELRVVSMFSL